MTEELKDAPSGEQAADFAALQRMAADKEIAPGQPSEAEPAQPERAPLEVEIAGILKMISGMIRPALPSVADLYSEAVCEAVGNSVAPVCNKYGWLQEGIGGKYAAELGCLFVVGPLAWATVEAAKGDIRDKKAKQGQKSGAGGVIASQSEPAQADAQKTVQIGAVIQ